MAIGTSGRIVIEVDPELKQKLHKLLRENGTNVKEWFTHHAVDYIAADSAARKGPVDAVTRSQEKS